MYSATQASSSRSNAATVTTVDVRQTPRMPSTGSSHGPITSKHNAKNTATRRISHEAFSDVDINEPHGQAKSTRLPGKRRHVGTGTGGYDHFMSPLEDAGNETKGASTSSEQRSSSHRAQRHNDDVAKPSVYLTLARMVNEIQGLCELETKQAEEIETLSEQLFAAAWRATMLMPRDIQDRCLEQITELLGEGVGQHLRREGKLPERSPSWDFGNLAPGPVLPRGTEKRRLEEPREGAITVDSTATTNTPPDACSPSKRRRLETERLFNSQEVSWAAQVFEEEDSEPQGDGGDDTDPDSDGTEPDSDGTEPDDDAEEPTAPQASTSPASSSSANVAHPLATTPPQRPRPLQHASTSHDLSFNGSLSALPNPPTPTPATPRPKSQKKVRPQNIPVPYSQAAGTWQEKGVLERCWDGWGYINGRLYLNARNEVSRDRMANEWIDRMI